MMDGHSNDAFEYWSDEVANHPFWSEFFRRGVPMHPELKGLNPTGNMRKIGPNIGNSIQVDVAWTPKKVSCRPLSNKPENLRPLLRDRATFEAEVGVPQKWSEGSSEHIGVTVLPSSAADQKTWSTERQVTETLELYGRIKKFVGARI